MASLAEESVYGLTSLSLDLQVFAHIHHQQRADFAQKSSTIASGGCLFVHIFINKEPILRKSGTIASGDSNDFFAHVRLE